MSITSVYPPSTTPGGWFGCFGPPSIVATNVPVAWPVSGQLPCGNGTVESCCIIGDQCLSNGVCQILPVANSGQDPLYYGAYCTDPTFSSPGCAANCGEYSCNLLIDKVANKLQSCQIHGLLWLQRCLAVWGHRSDESNFLQHLRRNHLGFLYLLYDRTYEARKGFNTTINGTHYYTDSIHPYPVGKT